MLVSTTVSDTSAPSSASKAAASQPAASPPAASSADDQAPAFADSVSLSLAAKRALTIDAAPAPSSADLQQAADLLNNSEGTASVADQIGAFAVLTGFVADGANLDTPKDRATVATAGAALYDSTFAKHQQSLLNAVNSRLQSAAGAETSASLQDALSVFNGFSADDQQIYLGAVNLQAKAAAGGGADAAPAFASAASYSANLQAQVGVHSALEAANAAGTAPPAGLAGLAGASPNSDAWTAQAQAYFVKAGPPPPADPGAQHFSTSAGAAPPTGAALMSALMAVNDDSGRADVQTQLAAYDLLTGYAANGADKGPARDAVLQSFQASPFAKHVAQVSALMSIPVLAADQGAELLARLNGLTPDDQQIALHQQNQAQPGVFASIDSLKANDTARSQVTQVIQKIFAKFGGDDLTKLTDPRLVKNPAFQELLTLTSENPASDGWTTQASKVLMDIAKSLDLVPDDPHAADAAQALANLKAPAPVTAGQAAAMKTFKQVQTGLQKARDDLAAKRTGKPAKTDKTPKSKADQKADDKLTTVTPDAATRTAMQAIYAPGETVNTVV
jgi:hypothetical protein